MEPTSGRGWAMLQDHGLDGMIYFHRGDESGFVAKRSCNHVTRRTQCFDRRFEVALPHEQVVCVTWGIACRFVITGTARTSSLFPKQLHGHSSRTCRATPSVPILLHRRHRRRNSATMVAHSFIPNSCLRKSIVETRWPPPSTSLPA